MQAVQFIKGYDVYAKGDIAGFNDDKAAQLVKLGVALLFCPVIDGNANGAVVPPDLPQQVKPANLCAICGQQYEAKDDLTAHKNLVHGIL